MLRMVLACMLFLASISCCRATQNILEPIRKQPSLQELIPDAAFTPGMIIPSLEQEINLKYNDWRRSEKERAFNNRKDQHLPQDAKESYLQRISIGWEDYTTGATQRYGFALTSPLGSPVVYSVAYEVTFGERPDGPISLQAWLEAFQSVWGRPHGGKVSQERTRVTYFFDRDGRLVDQGGDVCGPLYEMFSRLDEKTPSEVKKVIDFLEESKCAYSVDNIIHLNEKLELSKSTIYYVDFNLQANDVLKRVGFGSR